MKLKLTAAFAAIGLIFSCAAFAQSPQMFSYQGVARDNAGNVLANQSLTLRTSILETSSSGNLVYQELHGVNTNQFGIFNIRIGSGSVISGDIETIDWGITAHFLQVEMDPNGGNDFQNLGVSQLLSVPYALYAESSGTPGPTGPAGADGATGPTGPTGAQGPAGSIEAAHTSSSTEQFFTGTNFGWNLTSVSGPTVQGPGTFLVMVSARVKIDGGSGTDDLQFRVKAVASSCSNVNSASTGVLENYNDIRNNYHLVNFHRVLTISESCQYSMRFEINLDGTDDEVYYDDVHITAIRLD